MIKYPKELPLPLLEGRSSQRVDGVLRTKMQSGRSRSRLVFSKTPTGQNFRLLLSEQQAYFFELWFNSKLKTGALEFEMPVRMTDGLRERAVKFNDMYSGPTLVGPNLWQITANIEIRDPSTSNDDPMWVDFPEFILGADIIDKAVNREWPKA